MSEQQAQELLDYIELDHKPGYAYMRQLASGPWVVIVGKGDYFCWSFADWTAYRQAEEHKALQEVS